jgi:hypothetical protein
MSGDRLERIEAALDNQVEVNATLRTSVEQLRATTEALRATTEELRATAEALLSTVQIHQQNFEVLTARQLQTESQFQEHQRTTSAAIDRMSAILDYLVRQSSNNG